MSNPKVRYGATLRKRADAADKQRIAKYPCPACGKEAVKRRGYSKWECRSCGATFAGGAYSLTTPIGDASKRLLVSIKKGAAEQKR